MRTQRSFWNYTAAALSTGISLGCSFFSTPFVLRWLGTERFGLYRTTQEWVDHLGLTELALSDSILPSLTRGAHGGGAEAKKALIAGVRAYARVIPLKLIAGLGLVAAISRLVVSSPEHVRDLRIACAIGILSSLLNTFIPIQKLFDAKQLSYRIARWRTLQIVFYTGLALAFSRAGGGIGGQAFAVFASALVFTSLTIMQVLPMFPGLLRDLFKARTDRKAWGSIWGLNRTLLIANACGRLSFMSDNIIIAAFLTPAHVASFYLSQRIIVILQGQLGGIGNATWAALAELKSQGEHARFEERLVELTNMVVVLGLCVLGPVAAFNSGIIALWVGATQYAGNTVTALAVFNAISVALVALWCWIFSATGAAPVLLPQYFVFTVVNIAASVVCTRLFGMPGPLMGTALASVTVSLWVVPRLLEKHFQVSGLRIMRAALVPAVVLAPLLLALGSVVHAHPFHGVLGLCGALGASILALLGLSWLTLLNASDRALWRSRLRLKLW